MMSIIERLVNGGVYIDLDSPDLIKSRINFRLLTYKEWLKLSMPGGDWDIALDCIESIENVELGGDFQERLTNKSEIKKLVKNLDYDQYKSIIDFIIEYSSLSIEEFRRLEYVTYYLNWKADEYTRRISYDCDKCRKFNFLDTRLCYLEEDEIELPNFKIIESDQGLIIEDNGVKSRDIDSFFALLNELSRKEPNLSLFEIGLKYFGSMTDDEKPGKRIELCPEAIKIKSIDIAEIFEMEVRTQEYNSFPYNGSQLDQPNLLIQCFDAIRSGRNMFHSKKMEDLTKRNKK